VISGFYPSEFLDGFFMAAGVYAMTYFIAPKLTYRK